MRRLAHVLVAVTSLLTAVFIAGEIHRSVASATGGGTALTDSAFVDHLMFDDSLKAFTASAKARTGPDGVDGDTWFDWATDFCSAPLVGNTGRSFNFTEPCRRHDFGYRNAKLLEQRYGDGYWNGAVRKRIDQQFLSDMKAHCHTRSFALVPTCLSWAYAFYGAVRAAGGP